jgi:glycosyltransferase involved in cell wall biosynthesis
MGLYGACDVSIQVSSHEGVGMGFYESLAKATPVISLDVPPHNEVVLHRLTGWLLKAELVPLPDNDDPVSRAARFDAQELADLIISLEREEVAAMIRSTAKVHRERFDDASLKLRLIRAIV